MLDMLTADPAYTGPALTEEMIAEAESSLGVRLPEEYLELLRLVNGGIPSRCCYYTEFPTSWAADHFEVSAILGIGGSSGVDSREGVGSADLVREWQYPPVGVVICDTPSGGHDTVMLDYTECGSNGSPRVVYVDEDRMLR